MAAWTLLETIPLPLRLLSALVETDFRLPLRVTRSAMSTLASVVSLGSPGSRACGTAIWSELERWRLLGWAALVESVFLWVPPVRLDSGAVVSPSSPEASRDSAWMVCFWSLSRALAVVLRLRFPAPCDAEFGDDMVGRSEWGISSWRKNGQWNSRKSTRCGFGLGVDAVDRPESPGSNQGSGFDGGLLKLGSRRACVGNLLVITDR